MVACMHTCNAVSIGISAHLHIAHVNVRPLCCWMLMMLLCLLWSEGGGHEAWAFLVNTMLESTCNGQNWKNECVLGLLPADTHRAYLKV